MKWRSESAWWEGAPFPPRKWQAEALRCAVGRVEAGARPVVHAVMGAGKSVFIAELVRSIELERGEVVVISAPTRKLVVQLARTVAGRVGSREVGRFFSDAKETNRPVIVACFPSMERLAEILQRQERRAVLWIVDEAHNSECDSIHNAYLRLDPERLVGLSATPYRSKEGEALQLFDETAYTYDASDALRDGVIVPWKVRQYGGLAETIDDACVEMIRRVVAEDLGPGVVDAHSFVQQGAKRVHISGIKDAEAFARRLSEDEGIRAMAVHSELKGREVDRRIRLLKEGQLQVLVHVAMLKEGVDLPWLRWLCLRRQVSSRVWFAQHVGRVLRSHPGKEEAIILDPGDLFGTFGLSYAAVLGGRDMSDSPLLQFLTEEQTEALHEAQTKPGVLKQKGPRLYLIDSSEPKRLNQLQGGIRQLYLAMEAAGLLQRPDKVPFGRWRRAAVTKSQIQTLGQASRYAAARLDQIDAPPEVRELLRFSYRNARQLTKGGASDLISILFALSKAHDWPDVVTRMVRGEDVPDPEDSPSERAHHEDEEAA